MNPNRLRAMARQVHEIAEGKATDQAQALKTLGRGLEMLLEASAAGVEARTALMQATLQRDGEVDARLQDIEASLMLHGLQKPDDGDKVQLAEEPTAEGPGGTQPEPEPEQVPG